MQAVILAAGKGSRLHPITLNRSKAMLPILGKPIVERVMEGILACRVSDFILVIAPTDQLIIEHFRSRCKLKAQVSFIIQPEQRGMADALCHAAPAITGDFILSACDNLVPAEHIQQIVERLSQDPHSDGVISLLPIEPERMGNVALVEMEGDSIKRIVEKPIPGETKSNISSLPLYAFNTRILGYLEKVPRSPRGEYELQDAIQMLIEDGGRISGVYASRRLTLTNIPDLLAINREYLSDDHYERLISPQSIGHGTQIIAPVYIETGTIIGVNCQIGPYAYIEHDCNIGDGVVIENAVILAGTSIVDNAVISRNVVALNYLPTT